MPKTLTAVLALLTMHFVADFVFQSDWMATNKSKNIKALLAHTSTYAVCFWFVGIKFVLITFVLHTLVDAITSQITSRLWAQKKVHLFFVTIGFDQLLHAYQLILTWWYLYR